MGMIGGNIVYGDVVNDYFVVMFVLGVEVVVIGLGG